MKSRKFHRFPIIIFLFQSCLIATLVIACNSTTIDTVTTSNGNNNRCVKKYDSSIDYFPAKTTITHATGLAVEYHKNYKIVTVKKPWQNADTAKQYVLVQCGTPVPNGFKQTQIITVPVNTIVSLSTTHLPHLAKLGVVDKLIGVNDIKLVNTPEVLKKIKTGKIAAVGNNTNINVERLIELNPDIVTTYGEANPQTDSYPKLTEAGLKVAINAEYMETSPLGRSEWLKFTALFFNQEEKAEKIFNQIAKKYQAIAALAKSVKNHPKVLVGFNFNSTWYMPGSNSYVAKYLTDAGTNYLWNDNQSSGTLPLSFEAVYERATNADYWLNLSQSWKNRQDILTADHRYADFKAVKTDNLYNNNARINNNGGNDYWESGISNPDIILSDLIKIFHPEILPNHQLIYYRKLP